MNHKGELHFTIIAINALESLFSCCVEFWQSKQVFINPGTLMETGFTCVLMIK